MTEQHDEHQDLQPNPEEGSQEGRDEQQKQLARRTLLKAGWVAPVVFSVAANKAFAASGGPSRRRR